MLNNATHLGPWTYGPPTGRNWVNRGMAHCLVQDNKVVEEWVVRDEFAVLRTSVSIPSRSPPNS